MLANLMTRSQQLHDMALLSLHCGLRAGEIFDLTWGCVNFSNGSIILMNTKSGKNRTAYMTHEVRDMVSAKSPGSLLTSFFLTEAGIKSKKSPTHSTGLIELGLNVGLKIQA